MKVINIIPEDYAGDPHKALGYAWQDISEGVSGCDVIIKKGENHAKAAKSAMADLGVQAALVNCMWPGGFAGNMPANKDEPDVTVGETLSEAAAINNNNERLALSEQDNANANHPGWCNKCHSYCHGDCDA